MDNYKNNKVTLRKHTGSTNKTFHENNLYSKFDEDDFSYNYDSSSKVNEIEYSEETDE